MQKSKSFLKNDSGLAVVEAAILLPLCIVMVIAVYYASLFLCQKANMQANLQNSLVYYKNTESDTYVTANSEMAYQRENALVGASGSAFSAEETRFPYRFFAMEFEENDFDDFFHSMAGYMFFETGDNITITADTENYVVYQTITAKAEQTLMPAISLSMVGMPDSIKITAYAKVVISDADDFIRNTDLAVDLVADTKLGQSIAEIGDKIVEVYQNIKSKLG